jgi:drug/metabolite transporter superfamily protein YnfA
MRTRTAVFYLLLIAVVALAVVGLLYWLRILSAASIGSIGLLAAYGAIYVVSRWRRS